MSEESIERVHGAVLDAIDRREKLSTTAIICGAIVEAAFLLAYVLLADFSNRTHVLLLLATIAVYTLMACGLFALGSHVSRCSVRLLRAIELTRQTP